MKANVADVPIIIYLTMKTRPLSHQTKYAFMRVESRSLSAANTHLCYESTKDLIERK